VPYTVIFAGLAVLIVVAFDVQYSREKLAAQHLFLMAERLWPHSAVKPTAEAARSHGIGRRYDGATLLCFVKQLRLRFQ
jgi:hypothetical protein